MNNAARLLLGKEQLRELLQLDDNIEIVGAKLQCANVWFEFEVMLKDSLNRFPHRDEGAYIKVIFPEYLVNHGMTDEEGGDAQ